MVSNHNGEDTSLRILQNMKQMGSTVLHLKKDVVKFRNMVILLQTNLQTSNGYAPSLSTSVVVSLPAAFKTSDSAGFPLGISCWLIDV